MLYIKYNKYLQFLEGNMKFFDNIYDVVAKKWGKVFAIIGFSAYAAAILFEFIGGFVEFKDGGFGYFVLSGIKVAILAGLVFGFFFKHKKLLLTSFVAFLTLMLYAVVGGRAEIVGELYGDSGADVGYGLFGIVFASVVVFYFVILILDYVFNIKKLNFLLHLVFLLIFATGLIYWITGICYAAVGHVSRKGVDPSWTNGLVPLFQCATFLFVPAVLELGNEIVKPAPKKEEAPAPVEEEKEEAPAEEVAKEEAPEVVEPEVKEDKPAPKKTSTKKK